MKFGGRCAYCGCELPEKGWHADHVEAVLRKSEQCMKAAAKGIFKLKATGNSTDQRQRGWKTCFRPVHPATC